MTLCTFPFLFCLLAIWTSSSCEKPAHIFFFFSIFTKLNCLPISYGSLGILYILDARFLPYTHIHTHTHTHMSMWEQNPHTPLTPTKFWCEMNDKKTFMVLIFVVYSVLTAVSLKLMNILWTDSIWEHCPCHQFHSALCRRLERHGLDSWVWKTPWSMKWQPTAVFLPGESHDRGAWQAVAHGVTKLWAWLKRHSTHLFICIS